MLERKQVTILANVWHSTAPASLASSLSLIPLLLSSALMASIPPASAQSISCGNSDFNCDGHPDILWRNYGAGPEAGENAVWFMDGASYVSTASLPSQTDRNWQIVGTGDFNGDTKPDIVWRNKTSGQHSL
ncbi:FG-GAP repeat domain-containing protein [Gloeobacter morelensis]|uniref:VCBS repeat-containing protein n=1 Tax=Gloeobacter morelensis MG652769 TaxID=2781736 RepID=A0ABY3PSH3_9CYAN|nr:VCBS repeat-containing protein [Gloeobacter morelensis]UFP96680.1 VCBS repeat-containing protein [Gloeobacter morelensis MG652769]